LDFDFHGLFGLREFFDLNSHELAIGLGSILFSQCFTTIDDMIKKIMLNLSAKSMHEVRHLSFCSYVNSHGTSQDPVLDFPSSIFAHMKLISYHHHAS
jgi:hypothetical protein